MSDIENLESEVEVSENENSDNESVGSDITNNSESEQDVEELEEEEDDDEDEDEDEDEDNAGGEEGDSKPVQFKSVVKKKEIEIESEESDEDVNDEFDFQKFNSKMKDDLINDYHKEEIVANYDEVYQLSLSNRNEFGIIDDSNHQTLPILSKFEKTKIIGIRSKQLLEGLEPLVNIDSKIIDTHLIAEKELEAKVLPFIIKRALPNGKIEYWKIEDLEIVY